MPSWKKVITSGSSAHLNELTSSTFLVDGNKSGQFIAVIDNDENSSGHVLKLATDGTGNGTHVLDMENGSNTMFRARADGRFAFGNSAVGSMGAGTFVVGIDGGHTSDIAISKRLQHLGDGDTYIDFETNKIILSAGGNLLDYTTTQLSGSAATTASFGRLEVTTISASRVDVDAGTLAIGGTELGKTQADNLRNTTGTNTGDVTLSGTPDYITISNQVITRNAIDLANDVTGTLPVGNGGTGATSLTDGGVLLGSGTGAITATAVLTNGQLLIGDNSGDPTVATLTGTSNQVTVTNGGGSITLSTPQDLDTSADVTFDSVTLDDLTASRLVATNGSKKLVSSDLNNWVAGTSNQISVADDSDGTITLSTPQNIHTGATPTFAGVTTSGNVSGSAASTYLSPKMHI